MSASPSPTDLEPLIAAVLRGDGDAIDRFYRHQYPEVWRLCCGLLAADADDIAVDAMLHLFDRLPQREPGRTYRPWRNTVVLNYCRDRRRRLKSRRRAEEHPAAEAWPSALPRPDEAAEDRELAEYLRRALSTLPEREREAFVLTELEGMPTADAAAAMQVKAASVRSLRTLARRRLRSLLAERVPHLAAPAGGKLEP
jgi:RNA polymerase sigma-70 factor (ECF subfamily)